jgi:hypothetical protein
VPGVACGPSAATISRGVRSWDWEKEDRVEDEERAEAMSWIPAGLSTTAKWPASPFFSACGCA